MRSIRMILLCSVLTLAACGANSGDPFKVGKLDSMPATVEGHMQWSAVEGALEGSAEEEEAEDDDTVNPNAVVVNTNMGSIKAGDVMYSIEVASELLQAAGIAEEGVNGVKVRATLGSKSILSKEGEYDSYVVTAVTRL